MNFFRLTLIFLGFLPLAVFALSTDKQQIAYLQADSAQINHLTGVGIYKGHVKLTQGSTVITADTLLTHTDKQNQIDQATAIGQPATYNTMPDNSPNPFLASAQTIQYYPTQSLVKLIGDAKSTQGSDSFAGPEMTYDIKQQVVISASSSQGRTNIVIQPGQKIILPQ
jgi:lipopolysaccharide export system protein LptA